MGSIGRYPEEQAKSERIRESIPGESIDPNTPIRMYIALKLLRAWHNGTEGYCADVVVIIRAWIDGGMKGPIPYPASPFFREWATRNGYSEVDGNIGFRCLVEMRDAS